MKQKVINLLLVLSLMLNNALANNNDQIQATIDTLVMENNIPGLNFSVICENGEQFNYSSGYADTLNKIEMNENHVLFSGSVGKTYAVAVLMQLVDEGKINFEDLFLSYFPENDWLKNLPNIEKITIDMLITHTSGLPRYIEDPKVWLTLLDNPDKVWTYEERFSYAYNMQPAHEPGKGWAYSDTNYLLLGMLIEKMSGSNFYELVAEKLLTPGDLKNTHPSLKRDIPNLPLAYSHLNDDLFNMPGIVVSNGKYVFNPQFEWTGGGFASTTSDLAMWAKFYFEGKFFSDEMLDKIITPTKFGSDIGGEDKCGAGSFIYETKYGKAYGHTGFVPGFNTIFAYFPKHRLAMALQSNCDYAKKHKSFMSYLIDIMETMEF